MTSNTVRCARPRAQGAALFGLGALMGPYSAACYRPCVCAHTVLEVMLHELCHNEFGPHSASFYKLLDDITEECAQLRAKKQGGRGAGFDASGQKLGHRGGWGVAPGDPKAAAREAALKRAQHHSIMGNGGRLGGAAAPTQPTPQQAAADAALRRSRAQQFTRDNGLEDDALGEVGAADDGAGPSAAIPPAPAGPLQLGRRRCICGACGPDAAGQRCSGGGEAKQPIVGTGSADSPIELLDDDDDPPPAAQPAGPSRRRCVACGSPACSSCWACKACTRVNTAALSRCETCDTWRYAHA
jgi:hypothetical protein